MAKDRLKYFRIEAAELVEGLGQGVLALERAAPGAQDVARLLRLAHTLKGAARVVRLPGVADLAHAIEEALAPLKASEGPVPGDVVSSILTMLDAISADVAAADARAHLAVDEPARLAVDGPAPAHQATGGGPSTLPRDATGPAPQPAAGSASPVVAARVLGDDAFSTVRVEVEELDRLVEGVWEAAVQLDALAAGAEAAERGQRLARSLAALLEPRRGTEVPGPASLARARSAALELREILEFMGVELTTIVPGAERELAQVRARANWLRLVPAESIFAQLERAARDAADSLGKRVRFEASSEDARVDGHLLLALRDAFLHVIRNAVAHGIEAAPDRLAAGKPEAGQIRIRVERRGARVCFICQDDGPGIDLAAIREAVTVRGLLTPEQVAALGPDEVARLVFEPGLSTASSVDGISGRGVGLDVVRDIALRLKGDIAVRSRPGLGTSVEVEVPVSLSSLRVLAVEAGERTALLPLDAVKRTLRLREDEIGRTGDGETVIFEGAAVPFLALESVLSGGGQRRPGRTWSIAILHAGPFLAAVGVDRLKGTQDVVVQPLPAIVGQLPCVAGATLDSEGNPIPVLDPRGLVEAARSGRIHAVAMAAREAPAILVVDDSLTTRMMEQSILESAGFRVDLAVSAEEAMETARRRRYGLFVVDVEMPGMSGFEFVAATRADAALREVPAILVTSLGSPQDRQRGLDAGAVAYIVKGEFDQGRFLRTVREALS